MRQIAGRCGLTLCRTGSSAKLQPFLVASTCLLYLVAAGLFSRAIWLFEQQQWNIVIGGDAAELGDGPGSYDIDRSVWHVNVSLAIKHSQQSVLTPFSAVVQTSTAAVPGQSSMLSWDGPTLPLMDPLSHTTSTGYLLSVNSLLSNSAKSMAAGH